MAALRGMEWSCCGPEGFALPAADHGQGAARAASARGGRCARRRSPRGAAGAQVLYAKEWGATEPTATKPSAAARALNDWCVRDDWFATAAPTAA